LELLELTSPGRLPGMPHALPLKVVVKGPSDISDFALSYILETIRDSSQEIVTNLKKLDGTGGKAFKDASLSIETYNFDGILEDDILEGSTNPPSKSPRTVETVHPVQLMLRNVPPGYRHSAEVRSLILRFITKMLEERLENGLELIKVEYAGRLKKLSRNGNNNRNNNGGSEKLSQDGTRRKLQSRSYERQRRLEAVSIPLRVTVSGPADISDFALSYIMETIRDRFDDLAAYLRKYGESLDGDFNQNVFANVELSTDTFNFDDILTGPTDPPISAPTSSTPTRSPTEKVVVKVADDSTTEVVIMDDTNIVIAWWVWLIIALVIVLLCICCVCCCIRHRRNNAEKQKNQEEQAIHIWMQNGSVAAESKKTRKPQRPPRRIPVRDSEIRRTSKRPVRPSVKRSLSQIEMEEETREREYSGPIVPAYTNNAVVAYAISADPPEERALAPYIHHTRHSEGNQSYATKEPEGLKAPKKTSMYASEVYYSSNQGSDKSNEKRAEEPDGAKVSKQMSMFASDVCHSSPVVSGENGQEPRGLKSPKKDSMFVCPLEQLPEEVRAKSRSRTERDPGESRGKKKKKSKKKPKISREMLRSSLTKGSHPSGGDMPQDIESVSDSPSIRTTERDLKKETRVRAASEEQDDHHEHRSE